MKNGLDRFGSHPHIQYMGPTLEVSSKGLKATELWSSREARLPEPEGMLANVSILLDKRDELQQAIHSVDICLLAEAWLREEDYQGDTPLHKAARGGHIGCVNLLVHAGARVKYVLKHSFNS
ncbi:uncharacterized protein DEA37_0000985 [Paragonimus westermani]|uniref:Uncharacterized protein n=1 Tax=Paragonimus westermani TaxID=34504 RepID=A0A5J4NYP0_9TREM|nr:uncharacterized protein DEA37_0000985 [Paragonimus westermani]